MTSAPGTLYVVATPIGNLEDLTFRALRVLREVDLIAAEDTRRTSKLLARYEIRKPLISVREHNELREADRLMARLTAGENVALVSDAGTPGIADPGARLVRAVRTRGLKVVPIPGPSAVAAAMSVAGLVADGLPSPNWLGQNPLVRPPCRRNQSHSLFRGSASDSTNAGRPGRQSRDKRNPDF